MLGWILLVIVILAAIILFKIIKSLIKAVFSVLGIVVLVFILLGVIAHFEQDKFDGFVENNPVVVYVQDDLYVGSSLFSDEEVSFDAVDDIKEYAKETQRLVFVFEERFLENSTLERNALELKEYVLQTPFKKIVGHEGLSVFPSLFSYEFIDILPERFFTVTQDSEEEESLEEEGEDV